MSYESQPAELPARHTEIVLLDGSTVKINTQDHERLSGHTWTRIRRSSSPPVRREGPRGAQKLIWMHREILGLPRGREPRDNRRATFRNGDPLDCRRENLCIARTGEQRQKSPPTKRKPESPYYSQYVGVSRHEKKSVRWQAAMNIAGRRLYLGRFDTEEEAAKAYDRAATEHYGPRAKLNFPGPGRGVA